MNYAQRDHSHCWSTKNPPCGQKIKHFECCLCQKQHPEITADREAVAIAERVKVLQEVRADKWKTYELIDKELQTLTNKTE